VQKVDRLGWAAGIRFDSYGVRMGIRVNDPGILEHILPRLPLGWTPARSAVVDELFSVYCGRASTGSAVRHFDILYRGGDRLVRTLDRDELLDGVEGQVRFCVAEMATRRVFLHAGVVAWKGGAILIPGRSYSGKSRLVEALVRRGATYYSDEYALLDARARVHSYATPLSRRDESGRAQRVSPESLGGPDARPAVPVRKVVLTRYRAGADWKPRKLTPGRALLGLLDHAIPARRRPQDVLAALQRIVASAPVYKSARGDADAVAAALLDG
jgi:hypothetical protein